MFTDIGDPFEDFAELYELTHGDKKDDLPLYLEYAAKCGSPIFEVGCGTGRVTLALAAAGHTVFGIDLSEPMLKIARKKLNNQPAEIQQRVEFKRMDMSEIEVGDRTFPLFLMPYGEFAHVLQREQQERTLRGIADHLEPGGRLIIGMSNWDPREERISFRGTQIARLGHSMSLKYEGVFFDEKQDQKIVRYMARGYDPSVQTAIHVYVHEIMDSEGKLIAKKTNILPIRYVFRFEMELLLEKAGLAVEDIFGFYDKSEFKHDSRRMIFVARKN